MATDRILIQSTIAPKFLEELKAQLSAMASGSQPLPNVVNMASKLRLDKLLTDAIDKGAEVFFGSDGKKLPPGTAFIPTVIGGAKKDAELWEEEAFGPMAAYTVFETEEEAVEIANNQQYGLSAAVFTQDLRRGFRIARQLESGYVYCSDSLWFFAQQLNIL